MLHPSCQTRAWTDICPKPHNSKRSLMNIFSQMWPPKYEELTEQQAFDEMEHAALASSQAGPSYHIALLRVVI